MLFILLSESKVTSNFQTEDCFAGIELWERQKLLYIRNYPNKEVEVMKDIETILIGKVNFGFYSTNSFVWKFNVLRDWMKERIIPFVVYRNTIVKVNVRLLQREASLAEVHENSFIH